MTRVAPFVMMNEMPTVTRKAFMTHPDLVFLRNG
jgi:hypothetical protein